jgi:replication fork protection complex subunit Tof1/Swi1
MRGAVDEKVRPLRSFPTFFCNTFYQPKLWTELQAGIDCLIQLLRLIDVMVSSSDFDDEDTDAAEILQQQLVYNGEVLDISLESLRFYKEGTQTLAYLNSSVTFAYALLRMLEKWGKRKPGEVYVRRKKAKRNRKVKGLSCIQFWAL